jgi:chaperone BCS1
MNETIKTMLLPIISMYLVTMLSTKWSIFGNEIIKFIKKQFFTTIQVSNVSWVYYAFQQIIEDCNLVKHVSIKRFFTSRWGDGRVINIGIGNGIHILKYKNKYIFINITEEKTTFYSEDKYNMTLTVFGKKSTYFDDLKPDLYKIHNYKKAPDGKYIIYTFQDNNWIESLEHDKIDKNTIIIENKEQIFNLVKDFKTYNNTNTLGLLLYGPPGTGKSSIIKMISSYFDYNICYFRSSELEKLQSAILQLPNNSILTLEDIDSNPIVRNQKDEDSNTSLISGQNGMKLDVKKINLSDILNSLDGLLTVKGRFIIMTTNHIDKIDKALIRPGRIDICLEIGYITKKLFIEFLNVYYKDKCNNKDDFNNFIDYLNNNTDDNIYNKNVTMAMLINDYKILKLDYKEIFYKHFN